MTAVDLGRRQCPDNRKSLTVDMPSLLCRHDTMLKAPGSRGPSGRVCRDLVGVKVDRQVLGMTTALDPMSRLELTCGSVQCIILQLYRAIFDIYFIAIFHILDCLSHSYYLKH